jgi:hypothetical protein
VVVTQLLNKEKTENSFERVAYVCASPNGRSWPAGRAVSNMAPEIQPTIEVVAGAGYWVALSFLDVYAEGPGGGNVTAIDAATGKQVQLGVVAPLRTVINARGQAAFVARIEAPIENLGEAPKVVGEKLVAVEPSGKRKVLESGLNVNIPPASLKLLGSTVYWQDGGVEHTATL